MSYLSGITSTLDGTLTPATAVLDEAVPSPQALREKAMTTNADNNLSFIFTPLLSKLKRNNL